MTRAFHIIHKLSVAAARGDVSGAARMAANAQPADVASLAERCMR
jgi:hypothetical protein